MKEYTPFQRKVFKAVSAVPFGRRRSYQWVARRIGMGLALKKNKDLFIVPCHRVVMADGALGGYVLGKKMKKILLGLEERLTGARAIFHRPLEELLKVKGIDRKAAKNILKY